MCNFSKKLKKFFQKTWFGQKLLSKLVLSNKKKHHFCINTILGGGWFKKKHKFGLNSQCLGGKEQTPATKTISSKKNHFHKIKQLVKQNSWSFWVSIKKMKLGRWGVIFFPLKSNSNLQKRKWRFFAFKIIFQKRKTKSLKMNLFCGSDWGIWAIIFPYISERWEELLKRKHKNCYLKLISQVKGSLDSKVTLNRPRNFWYFRPPSCAFNWISTEENFASSIDSFVTVIFTKLWDNPSHKKDFFSEASSMIR